MTEDQRPDAPEFRRHGVNLYSNGLCRCDVCRDAHRRYQQEWKQRTLERVQATGELPESVEHGSKNAFHNYGCRCRLCLDAAATETRERKARARASGVPSTVTHGTESTYVNYACRCDACREAHRVADRARLARRAAVRQARERATGGGDT